MNDDINAFMKEGSREASAKSSYRYENSNNTAYRLGICGKISFYRYPHNDTMMAL